MQIENTIKQFVFCIVFLITVVSINAQDFQPVQNLIARCLPALKNKVQFHFIDHSKKDTAAYYTKGQQLIVYASTKNAAAYALNDYLKKYCHSSFSHMGDHIHIPKNLPQTATAVSVAANNPLRYALNYCTISYTMSFYGWKEWAHELDWMALNGVNLMLAPVGIEIIWQNTLKQLGCSNKEISDFIAGPAYSAWWLMGNLEGWGGPVTQGIIDQQAALQKKILVRMKELGIQPVMQGFYGMAPNSLKERGYDLLAQGRWAGGFLRPAFLKPDDSFEKIADIYYSEMKKIYGSSLHYFAGDPFHEGGNSKGINVADYGLLIQSKMQEYFPGSTWVLQGWQANPSSQILSRLDKSKVLVQELFGENTDNWLKRKAYEGTPFIWCSVTNFGEKSGLYGKLQRFADEVYKADTSKYAAYMKGVGIMPEGIHNNPVVYDFILTLAWHSEKVDASDWIKTFVVSRYGKENEKLQQAWQVFLQTIYSSFEKKQEGPGESVFCARPSLNVRSVSSWGTRARNYDTQKFKEAVQLFVSASEEMGNSPTYQTDKIDFVRQVFSNYGEGVYQKMVSAYDQKDVNAFKKQSSLFLSLIEIQDSLLSCSEQFQLYRWLRQAWDFGKSLYEKKLALKNAKMQITYWGPDDPTTDLNEYANKEWNGLMRYFYLPRWKMFVENCLQKLQNNSTTEPDCFRFEKEWCNKVDLYKPSFNINSKKQEELIKKILSY